MSADPTTDLAVRDHGTSVAGRLADAIVPRDFDDAWRMARVFADAGMKGAENPATVFMKMAAAADLGVSAFRGVTQIHIINGSVMVSAALLAELVDKHPAYEYRPVETSDTRCEIAWFKNGEKVGTSEFTMDDAQRAGLAGKDNWRKFPSDLLWARALSRGVRRYAPGAIGANVYVEGELVEDERPQVPAPSSAPAGAAPPDPLTRVRDLVHSLTPEQQAHVGDRFAGVKALVVALGDREPTAEAILAVSEWKAPEPPAEPESTPEPDALQSQVEGALFGDEAKGGAE